MGEGCLYGLGAARPGGSLCFRPYAYPYPYPLHTHGRRSPIVVEERAGSL